MSTQHLARSSQRSAVSDIKTGSLMNKFSPHSPDIYYEGKCKHAECGASMYRAEGAHYAYCTSMHRHAKIGGKWMAAGDRG